MLAFNIFHFIFLCDSSYFELHIFVALRASTAYFCDGYYVEKSKKCNHRKSKRNVYVVTEGEDEDEEDDEYKCDDEDDNDHFVNFFIQNRSESMHRNVANGNGSKYANEPNAHSLDEHEPPQAFFFHV